MHRLSLIGKIKHYFPKHQEHVVKNLLIACWSIFEARSTNLNKAKDKIPLILGNGEEATEESNYTRLIRFFKTEDQEELVKSILMMCCMFLKPSKGQRRPKYLVLDGTEWEIGSKPIQLLTLCILWNGVAIPIWWEDLEKIGHSSQEERKAMIIKALSRYDLRGMILLADREYIGESWFTFLRSKGIEFVIRLKANIYHDAVNREKGPRQSNLKRRAEAKKKGQFVSKRIYLDGCPYHYIIVKNLKNDPKEPLVYLLTSMKKVLGAVESYALRWKIETCFKHLKTNGFNLEETNVKGKEKRELMMAVVVLLYVLALTEGFWATQEDAQRKKTLKVFKKSGQTTLAVSFFRKGIARLSRFINNLTELITWLTDKLAGLVRPSWCHV